MKTKTNCKPWCIAKHDQSEIDTTGGFCFTATGPVIALTDIEAQNESTAVAAGKAVRAALETAPAVMIDNDGCDPTVFDEMRAYLDRRTVTISYDHDAGYPVARHRGGAAAYAIQARTPSTPWSNEGSGDRYDTREAAENAVASLEPTNDDGAPIEYRVVEG